MRTGVMSCPAGKAADDAATQQLLARERALGLLCSAVEKARQGGHQYLSGTLHNVAKALANAQPQPGAHEAVLAAGYGSSEPLCYSILGCVRPQSLHLRAVRFGWRILHMCGLPSQQCLHVRVQECLHHFRDSGFACLWFCSIVKIHTSDSFMTVRQLM
jgi:hypothetical protein